MPLKLRAPRPAAAGAFLLLSAVSGFPSAQTAPGTAGATPPVRDGRRVAVVVGPGSLTLVSERDDGVPKEIPDRIEIRWGGRRVALTPERKERYAGAVPGTVRRFAGRLPRRSKSGLEVRDPAPSGSEPIRLSVSVDPAYCVESGPPARVVTTSRSPVVTLAEIYPDPGKPVSVTLAAAAASCAAPALPPKEVNRWDSHMSHQPRHDGTFFMAQDGFHHLEGVAGCGRFTLYVYDDRVLPLPSTSIAARVEYAGGSIVRLVPDPAGTVLTGPLPKGAKIPLEAVLFVRLVPGFPEFRFDFAFPFVDPCPSEGGGPSSQGSAASAGVQYQVGSASVGQRHELVKLLRRT